MTYLELVNSVLVRLREDTVKTVQGTDDVVVELVKEWVNDAMQKVQQAHTWTALSTEWEFTADSERVVLTNSSLSGIIDYIYDNNGVKLRNINTEELRRRASQGGAPGKPMYYVVDGRDDAGDLKLRLWPAPSTPTNYTAYGYQNQARLAQDTDRLKVPHTPVIYGAHAMSAQERGEVGGQTAGELLVVAQQFLSDAIALDASNTDMDNIWYQV